MHCNVLGFMHTEDDKLYAENTTEITENKWG